MTLPGHDREFATATARKAGIELRGGRIDVEFWAIAKGPSLAAIEMRRID